MFVPPGFPGAVYLGNLEAFGPPRRGTGKSLRYGVKLVCAENTAHLPQLNPPKPRSLRPGSKEER